MNITRIIRYMPVVIPAIFTGWRQSPVPDFNYIIDKCHQGELAIYLTGALLFRSLDTITNF